MIELLNYIKADIYKVLNRKYMYILLGILVLFAFGFNLLLRINKLNDATAYEMLTISTNMIEIPIFLVLMIVDAVTADQVKEHTLKNVISSGASRTKFYLANVITSVIIAYVMAAITLAVFCGSAVLLLQPGKGLTSAFMAQYFMRFGSASVLYIAGISIGILLAFFIKSNASFAFVYIAVILVPKAILEALIYFISKKFVVIGNALITTQLDNISKSVVTGNQMLTAVITGLIYIVVFVVIGIAVFRRQEIK